MRPRNSDASSTLSSVTRDTLFCMVTASHRSPASSSSGLKVVEMNCAGDSASCACLATSAATAERYVGSSAASISSSR